MLLEAGNYSLFHATFVRNVPVTEKLAMRAAIDCAKNDGYLESGAYLRA